MSMKRILGMMLASRMAGHGTRGGMGRGGLGAGLGGLAGAGMLGGRRGGLGRKAGLAALGYMAYRAYQDHQARTGGGTGQPPGGGAGASSGSPGGMAGNTGGGLGGGLGGIMKSVSDALTGSNDGQATRTRAGAPGAGAPPEAAFTRDDERAAETFSEETALLLVRGMVTAANADGTISPEERARVMAQADEAGADAEDHRVLERELANPRPLDELLGQVRDQETAEEFYLASRMAVDGTTEANRSYLAKLRERLGLPEEEAAEIDRLAT